MVHALANKWVQNKDQNNKTILLRIIVSEMDTPDITLMGKLSSIMLIIRLLILN